MANSYSDDLKVKISEKYKPPYKISMPMSYSQRLSLNKQLQDNRPTYDFHLETSALEKIRELKGIRKDLVEERNQRLVHAREEFDKKIEQETAEKVEKEKLSEAKLLEQSNSAKRELKTADLYTDLDTKHSASSQTPLQQNYVTKNGILMPIPATNYSTSSNSILKPVPMHFGKFEPLKSNVSKPFNLSDFENDTSSPFDNMELKSINDLEELAQVLKSDRSNFQQPSVYPTTSLYQTPVSYDTSANNKNYSNLPMGSFSQGVSNMGMFTQNTGVSQNYRQQSIDSSYSHANYNPPISSTYSQYNNLYVTPSTYAQVSNYNNQVNGYLYNIPQNMTTPQLQPSQSYIPMQPSMQKTNCKSVPDLVKSLEKELGSSKLSDSSTTSYHMTDVPIPVRPKSTDSVYKSKNRLLNPLDKLSKEQQEICRNVSVMGFPLDRVVRVCEVIGEDQKKIIDHLLALSELLVLGFSERDASEALLKNNNDRDKALDLLIS